MNVVNEFLINPVGENDGADVKSTTASRIEVFTDIFYIHISMS